METVQKLNETYVELTQLKDSSIQQNQEFVQRLVVYLTFD
jgi:hypothetical protein